MKRKSLILVLALVLVVSLLASCAKTNTPNGDASGSGNSAQGEIIGTNVKFDTGKELKGELNVWFYEDGKRFIQPLFDDYQKYRPDVKLNVTYIPWGDYWKKLPVSVSGGSGPDLFYFHNMHQIIMVDGELMAPYPEDLVDNLKKDYLNVEAYETGGETYYIATGGGHGIIYYNKTLWKEAGLTEADFPETWEELREIAIKLTKKDGDKVNVAGFNFNPGGGPMITDWSLMAGRFLFSEDGKQITIDNDDFKKSLKFFTDLYTVDKVCTPTFPESIQSFQDGTTAMMWQHPWFSGMLKAQMPDFDFGIFPQPKFEGAKRNWHYNNPDVSMGINSKINDTQKELAVDLLTLFFAEDKYMREWNVAQALAPSKVSLQTDEVLNSDPIIQVLMKDFDNSVYIGPSPDAVIQDLIQNLVDPILKGGVSVDDAIKASVEKVNKTLEDFNWQPAERIWTHADELK